MFTWQDKPKQKASPNPLIWLWLVRVPLGSEICWDNGSLVWWLALSRHDFLLSPAKLYLMTISFPPAPVLVQRIIVPNVTRTSFDVTRSTEFLQSPAFQFLLLQKKQLIWETKTQYRSLTVSDLEPGALYIVEIRTDVCREESKLVHQKVKTSNLIQK